MSAREYSGMAGGLRLRLERRRFLLPSAWWVGVAFVVGFLAYLMWRTL